MIYNTKREKLIIPEYGRVVHNMISHAISINDKKTQQDCVNSIITFMGQMNPHLRDTKEYKHKLWDQLHIMSDFKLDIESPYEKPELKKLTEKPQKMRYPKNKIKFSFYGNTIPQMIQQAITMKGDEKRYMTGMIANQMKKCYILFNQKSVDNATIILHLSQLSEGKLKLPDDFEFIRSSSIRPVNTNKKSYKKKSFKKKK